MDFGEILKKWEQGQGCSSRKSAMDVWLEKNEITDKDAYLQKSSGRGEYRRRMMNTKPDAVIDIHGNTSDEAWIALEQFFENAKNSNYEKLRIIHGKGNHTQGDAVLSHTVRRFLEQCSYAGESGFEKSIKGGSGATWVLLKKVRDAD